MSHIKKASEHLIDFFNKEVGHEKADFVDEKDDFVLLRFTFKEGLKDKVLGREYEHDLWEDDMADICRKLGLEDYKKVGKKFLVYLPYKLINLAVILHPPHNEKEVDEVEENISKAKIRAEERAKEIAKIYKTLKKEEHQGKNLWDVATEMYEKQK